MLHQEATRYLVDFADGALGPHLSAAVQEHADECADCRSWIETYQDALTGLPQVAHASAGDIANLAVEPSALPRQMFQRLTLHIEECSSCRREYRSASQALKKAKDVSGLHSRLGRWMPQLDLEWRPVLAGAAVLIAIVTIGVMSSMPGRQHEYVLTDRQLGGQQLIQTSGELVATNVHVAADSDVIIRASRTTLGEKFSVGRGGRLVIGTNDVSRETSNENGRSPRR